MGITIGQLVEDLIPFTEEGNKVVNIEIMPKKAIQKIIAKCREIEYDNLDDTDPLQCERWSIANDIEIYAKRLINEFEKGGE